MDSVLAVFAVRSQFAVSSQVPVDYTQVRHVSKPNGAKPGMVIYVDYNTVYVTPDEETAERLRESKEHS